MKMAAGDTKRERLSVDLVLSGKAIGVGGFALVAMDFVSAGRVYSALQMWIVERRFVQ